MRLRHRAQHLGGSFVVPSPSAQTSARHFDEDRAQQAYDVPAEMAEEAEAHGAPAVEWWLARAAGASVEQSAALSAWGPEALLAAALSLGAPPVEGGEAVSLDELLTAVQTVSPFRYLAARCAGFCHSEAVVAARADLASVEAAAAHFGKPEVIEALSAGVPPADYAVLRRVAAHADALEAFSIGIPPADYVLAAGSGATHAEIVEVVRSGSNLWDYARRRNLGLTPSVRQPA